MSLWFRSVPFLFGSFALFSISSSSLTVLAHWCYGFILNVIGTIVWVSFSINNHFCASIPKYDHNHIRYLYFNQKLVRTLINTVYIISPLFAAINFTIVLVAFACFSHWKLSWRLSIKLRMVWWVTIDKGTLFILLYRMP